MLSYTRVSMGFRLYQVIDNPCLYQGHRYLLGTPGYQRILVVKWSSTILRLYQVIDNPSFIPGHKWFLVYTREKRAYSHQWPRCVERFFGLYTPEERFLGRLRVWRLGERDPRLLDDSGQWVSSDCLVSEMSTMVGGHSARFRLAILASLLESVNDFSLFSCPEGDSEKESRRDRCRAGEERPVPEKESRRMLEW